MEGGILMKFYCKECGKEFEAEYVFAGFFTEPITEPAISECDECKNKRIEAIKQEAIETLRQMIFDWQADNAPNYDDLIIDEIIFNKDFVRFEAIAHDEKTIYSLMDDGTNNIMINYVGSR